VASTAWQGVLAAVPDAVATWRQLRDLATLTLAQFARNGTAGTRDTPRAFLTNYCATYMREDGYLPRARSREVTDVPVSSLQPTNTEATHTLFSLLRAVFAQAQQHFARQQNHGYRTHIHEGDTAILDLVLNQRAASQFVQTNDNHFLPDGAPNWLDNLDRIDRQIGDLRMEVGGSGRDATDSPVSTDLTAASLVGTVHGGSPAPLATSTNAIPLGNREPRQNQRASGENRTLP
jgi:hypothetical protein